jgi:glycosyltransferase involved in cell wall biosynthesis
MNCRLLYLVGGLGPGGLERQLYLLLQAMDRERYRPAVAVWNFHEDEMYVSQIRALNVPLHSFPSILSRSAKLKAFRRLVMRMKPEVVHSYSFYTNFGAWCATVGSKVIPIGSIRQNFISERRLAGMVLGRLSARLPVTQICNSLAAKNTVEYSASFSKPARVYLVRNGLDIEQFKFRPLPLHGPSLIGVGRLFPEKRWDRLLKCIALVAASGLRLSVRLVGEGPLRRELESQARHLGLNGLVQFLGHQNNISALLEDSTFLVHTADAEGCPNVVMEAMACGRAVIATDAGDVPFLIEDGKTGFVVRCGDDEALVDRTVKLINDHHLCRRMGEAGRTKAEREFGLDRLVSDTLAVYRAAGWKDSFCQVGSTGSAGIETLFRETK